MKIPNQTMLHQKHGVNNLILTIDLKKKEVKISFLLINFILLNSEYDFIDHFIIDIICLYIFKLNNDLYLLSICLSYKLQNYFTIYVCKL